MYQHRDYHIDGENEYGRLTVKLSKLEEEKRVSEFQNIVLDWAKYDNTMNCALVDIAGEQRVFVADAHSAKRAQERSRYSPAFIRERARYLLTKTMAGAEVIANFVLYDEDTGDVCAADNFKATAVVDAETGVVFVFHCGCNYVRLATVWKGRRFGVDRATKLVKVDLNGWMITNPDDIPEAYIFHERVEGKPQHRVGVLRS